MRITLKFSKAIIACFCLLFLAYSAFAADPVILRGHTNAVSAIDISRDGKLLASASLDKTVRLWDTATNQSRILSGHSGEVYAVAFSPDNQMLASSDYTGKVILWNVKTGKQARTIQIKGWSVAMGFSPDGKNLAVGSQTGIITIYDVQTGNESQTIQSYGTRALTYSPNGRYLASDGRDINIFDLQTGKTIKKLSGHTNSIREVLFSADSRMLASASTDKTARIWNVETGESLKTLQTETPRTVAWSRTPIKWKMAFLSVSFSPDEKTLATATGTAVHLWDVAAGTNTKTLEGHTQSVTCVRYFPDGKRLASASLDGTIRIWTMD